VVNMKSTHPLIKYAAIIVWLHLLMVIAHGLSHIVNHVNQSILSYAFIIVVILATPLLALLLLSTRRLWPGTLLLTVSMLGSLLFGLVNHFMVPGTDNIAQVMPGVWQTVFLLSSILLAISEAIGTVIGLWCLFALGQPHAFHRKSESFEGE
jgi:hypothetical protein